MRSDWVRRDTNTAALLCIAGGIADAIGYVQSGVFAANMTGNTVLTGISLANGDFAVGDPAREPKAASRCASPGAPGCRCSSKRSYSP